MRPRWHVIAYGRPVSRPWGDLEALAGASTKTRLGARWWKRRMESGWPLHARYEVVEIHSDPGPDGWIDPSWRK